jgi:general stress protein 26
LLLVYTELGALYRCIFALKKGRLIKDKAMWQQHWDVSLHNWFPHGVETPGLVLIAVKANHIKYWDKYKKVILKFDQE